MKKRFLSMVLLAAITASLITGCALPKHAAPPGPPAPPGAIDK